MTAETQVKALLDKRIKKYKEAAEEGFLYPDSQGRSRVWERIERKISRVIDKNKTGSSVPALEELSRWHLGYSQFLRVHRNDPAQQKTEYIKACWYGYLALRVGDEAYECVNRPYMLLQEASQYQAQCILAGWWNEARELGQRLVNAINNCPFDEEYQRYRGTIIDDGFEYSKAGWFLLELHCKQHKVDFDRDKADYPELFVPYQAVLEHWDSTDLTKIDQLVYLLCDMHLQQTEQQDEDTPEEDVEYFEFDEPTLWLYPYEILAWLALREHNGLENPASYSHPLMNQPLAERVPGAPFEKPLLKEAQQLLKKVRELCPDADLYSGMPEACLDG